jgi:hypothetical protein
MAMQHDPTDELQARLDTLAEHLRAAKKKRLLVARGIALWNHAEAEWALTQGEPPPPERIN